MSQLQRPPFIISTGDVPEEEGRYPGSDELLSRGRPVGKAAGLLRIGLHIERLAPGHRLSYPHAPHLLPAQPRAAGRPAVEPLVGRHSAPAPGPPRRPPVGC